MDVAQYRSNSSPRSIQHDTLVIHYGTKRYEVASSWDVRTATQIIPEAGCELHDSTKTGSSEHMKKLARHGMSGSEGLNRWCRAV